MLRLTHVNACGGNKVKRVEFTPGGQDDDFGSCWRDTDLHTGVPVLGQLSGQKLIQLGFEDAI